MSRLTADDVLEILHCRAHLAVQQGSHLIYTTNNLEKFDDTYLGTYYLDEPHQSFLSSQEDSESERENDSTPLLSRTPQSDSPTPDESDSPTPDESDYDIKPIIAQRSPLKELEREARKTAERHAEARVRKIEEKFKQISLEFQIKFQGIRDNQRMKINHQQAELKKFEKESLEIAQRQLRSLQETKDGESVEERIAKAEQAKRLAEQHVRTKIHREQANALYSQLQNLLNHPIIVEKDDGRKRLADALHNHLDSKDATIETLANVIKQIEMLKGSVELEIQQFEANQARNIHDQVEADLHDYEAAVSKLEPPRPKAHPVPPKSAHREPPKSDVRGTGVQGRVVSGIQLEQESDGSDAEQAGDELACTHAEAFKEFMRLNALIGQSEKISKTLSESTEGKKLKFDLMKAVNVNINSISVHSGGHLTDKYRALTRLITGDMVTVGNRRVSTHGEPNSTVFTCNLLASKLVAQADEQVSVRAETAIPLGCVGAGLMNPKSGLTPAHMTVRDLIFAHLYAQCPYLVPYYPPPVEGQTTAQYHDSLGYKVVAGEIESQGLFVKRQAGLARLFAALLVTPLPGGSPNPSLPVVWRYLVATLNLTPRPVVTATVMHAVLETSGSALYQIYGSVFWKLLEVTYRSFVPKIRKITPEGVDGGATARLQLFLERALNENRIDLPKGNICHSFWRS